MALLLVLLVAAVLPLFYYCHSSVDAYLMEVVQSTTKNFPALTDED